MNCTLPQSMGEVEEGLCELYLPQSMGEVEEGLYELNPIKSMGEVEEGLCELYLPQSMGEVEEGLCELLCLDGLLGLGLEARQPAPVHFKFFISETDDNLDIGPTAQTLLAFKMKDNKFTKWI